MSLLRALPFWLAAIGIGCGSRSLDPKGGSGIITLTGDAGTTAGFDGPRDVLTIEIIEPDHHCGDRVVDSNEECDDGNYLRGDGCDEFCQVECSFECGSCGPNPCTVNVVCGDGVLGIGEICDDANIKDGDGCSADCARIEPGWTCPLVTGPCYPICGDGMVVGPETCDDGDVVSGDGCSSSCLTEPTTAFCGDGKRSGAEQCDDGTANGTFEYDSCTANCLLGAHCGDGIVNGGEDCDFGTINNRGVYGDPSGCTRFCQVPHYCGDGIIDAVEGEQCDDGKWNGTGNTACATICRVLIH